MFSDLKLAFRGLSKAPGFAGVCVLILALGIGAVTVVFAAVEAVLLRPLPFERPQDLYCLQSALSNEVGLFSVPEFCTYRDQTRVFQGLAAMSTFNTNLVDRGEAQFVQGLRVSANSFELLGARPAAGRLLVPEDDQPNAARVVVIGAALWQRAFGGSLDAIGRTISIDGEPRVIVGVLPANFVAPSLTFHTDFCVPLQADADPARYRHGSLHYLRVIGRMKPGISETQAQGDLASILAELRRQYPRDYAGGGVNRLTSLTNQIVGDSRPMLLTLLGLVLALLLLASTNLAGLHLVRAIGRRHDFAVRVALGATRLKLARFIFAECLVLAVAGGLAGLLLANWGLDSLLPILPANLPRAEQVGFDGAILLFVAAAAITFGLVPALAPLWYLSRADLRTAISTGGARSVGGQGGIRHLLASVQVALALALLACTGLFLRSFWAVSAQQLGFETSNALSLRLSLPQSGYHDREALIRHYEQLHVRLAAIPGVDVVGVTSLLPLVTGLATVDFNLTDRPRPPESRAPSANFRLVNPEYFRSMGIALHAGRGFAETDDARHPLVAVINTAIAAAYFRDRDPVGQRIDVQDTVQGFRTAVIVGVVANVKQGKIEDAPSFDIYLPYRQMDPVAAPWIRYRTFWVLRGTARPAAIESAVRQQVRAHDAAIAISSVHTIEQVADSALAGRRFTLLIVGFFAGAAVLLTVAGIYSVIAFGVAQRTREIGVRLALGARNGQIFGLVLGQGMVIAMIGAPLGLIGSLVLTKLISAQLYGVGPHDPLALAAAVAAIAMITLLACWIPARRAARIDPMVALRAD